MSHTTPTIEELQAEITRLQQRLADAENQVATVQRVLDKAPTLLYIYDVREQRNVYVNYELATLLDYTAEEIHAMGSALLPTLIHPEDMPHVGEHFARLAGAKDGEVCAVEYRMRHRNGTWCWFQARDTAFSYDEDGTLRQIIGTVQDTTHSKHMQAALLKSEERFRAIIEKIPAGVCITNEQQQFEYVNPAYCRIYHYTPAELIGQPFTIVVPEAYRPLLSSLHDQFMQEGAEVRGEWQVMTKDGQPLTVIADAALITGEDGCPKKATFVIDITALRQSEAERAILQQQVIAGQQDALQELSTPLIPIADHVVIMPLIGAVDSQRAQQVLETLLEGVAHHQASIVILDITGVQTVDTQVADALIRAAQAVKLLGGSGGVDGHPGAYRPDIGDARG